MKIIKDEIATRVADRLGLTIKQSREVTSAVIEVMIESLKNEDIIELRGLGTFKIKKYAGVKGVKFKASEDIRYVLNDDIKRR